MAKKKGKPDTVQIKKSQSKKEGKKSNLVKSFNLSSTRRASSKIESGKKETTIKLKTEKKAQIPSPVKKNAKEVKVSPIKTPQSVKFQKSPSPHLVHVKTHSKTDAPTPFKTVTLGPIKPPFSKVEQKESLTAKLEKSNAKSEQKVHEMMELKAANEKIKQLEDNLKVQVDRHQNTKNLYEKSMNDIKVLKVNFESTLNLVTELKERIKHLEEKNKEKNNVLNSLKEENEKLQILTQEFEEETKKLYDEEKKARDIKELEMSEQIKKFQEKLHLLSENEAQLIKAHKIEEEEWNKKLKFYETQMQEMKKQLKDKVLNKSKDQAEDMQVKLDKISKPEPEATPEMVQFKTIVEENQSLKEEINLLKKENEDIMLGLEAALNEKQMMNEKLRDAVDELEISLEEKKKLKNKFDFFKTQLTEANRLVEEEKKINVQSFISFGNLKNKYNELVKDNQQLKENQNIIDFKLKKLIIEKGALNEKINKYKSEFKNLFKKFEQQSKELEQILVIIRNIKIKELNEEVKKSIPNIIAAHQSIEVKIEKILSDKVEYDSQIKQYLQAIPDYLEQEQNLEFFDSKALIEELKKKLSEKVNLIEVLKTQLSTKMMDNKKEESNQALKKSRFNDFKSMLEENINFKNEIKILKNQNEELKNLLEVKEKDKSQLEEFLKLRNSELKESVKMIEDLQSKLDASKNSIQQIRLEYKNLLEENETINKSIETNINYKVFLENQIQMYEKKNENIDTQIEKLKNPLDLKQKNKKDLKNLNLKVKRVSSTLEQQICALKHEKNLVMDELENLKNEYALIIETIQKDRTKCEEISNNFEDVRKRLNEAIGVEKEEDYLDSVESKQWAVIRSKKDKIFQLIKQTKLSDAFSKTLKEIQEVKTSILEEPVHYKVEMYFQKLFKEISFFKDNLSKYKKSYQSSKELLKLLKQKLEDSKNNSNKASLKTSSNIILQDFRQRFDSLNEQIQKLGNKNKIK